MVTGVEIIDVDAILDDEATAGATGATAKAEVVLDSEGGCDVGDGTKKNSSEKTAAGVLATMKEMPQRDVRI